MIKKDLQGQEVKIGDWIATIPKGARSVEIGKIVDFTPAGNPLYKTNINEASKAVGLIVVNNYDNTKTSTHPWGRYLGATRNPQFVKIKPTKSQNKNYELDLSLTEKR